MVVKNKIVICVGSGCSYPVAVFAAIAAEASGAKLAKCMTPYEVVHSSFQCDLAVLVSAEGNHPDTVEAYCRLAQRQFRTLIITAQIDSCLATEAAAHSGRTRVVTLDAQVPKGGFIPVGSTLVTLGLALTTLSAPIDGLALFDRARTDHNLTRRTLPSFDSAHDFVIVSSMLGRAAAADFETRLAESGLGFGNITDPWHLGHGRYFLLANETREKVLVAFGTTPEQAEIKRVLGLIPRGIARVNIESEYEGIAGAAYSLFRSMFLISAIAEDRKVDPANRPLITWGNRLYMERRNAP
jgi:hypothetical protein